TSFGVGSELNSSRNWRFFPSDRGGGWYMISEIIKPVRRLDGPIDSLARTTSSEGVPATTNARKSAFTAACFINLESILPYPVNPTKPRKTRATGLTVIIQQTARLALTPPLSSEEREKFSWAAKHSPASDFFQRGRS